MRKCNHMTSRFTWREVKYGAVAVSRWCIECGVMLSMGPSNDEPAEVQVEIRAAELNTKLTRNNQWKVIEVWGSNDHRDDAYDELAGATERDEWYAGWLSREITTHDDREARDGYAWPWDPSRPVAGQYEEWDEANERAICKESQRASVAGRAAIGEEMRKRGFAESEVAYRTEGGVFADEGNDRKPREPGCECHQEEGDSPCPVHPPDAAELAYAESIGAPYADLAAPTAARDPNEPALDWQESVFAAIEADTPVLKPIDWPGYIGLEKPTGDPLDAETRKEWNADPDAMEHAHDRR